MFIIEMTCKGVLFIKEFIFISILNNNVVIWCFRIVAEILRLNQELSSGTRHLSYYIPRIVIDHDVDRINYAHFHRVDKRELFALWHYVHTLEENIRKFDHFPTFHVEVHGVFADVTFIKIIFSVF